MKSGKPSRPTAAPAPDLERIDEAVLALLWLTAWTERAGTEFTVSAAWKGHDWDALGRLHEKGFIGDPVGKQKSIVFTEEGRERAKALFEQMFCEGKAPASVAKIRHPFVLSAERLWAVVPEWAREKILSNVWCGHCREVRRIEDFTGMGDRGDLILRGFCRECGNVVVRLVETSETVPPTPSHG